MTGASDPRNPLANRSGYVHVLLQKLTDDEVAEFSEYWAAQREEYRVEGKGFASWNASKRLSAGRREAARRRRLAELNERVIQAIDSNGY